jgi:hypothetical protein
MELTREERLEIIKAAASLVHAGLVEPSALDGFRLSNSPRQDPLGALSSVYDGIARVYGDKIKLTAD